MVHELHKLLERIRAKPRIGADIRDRNEVAHRLAAVQSAQIHGDLHLDRSLFSGARLVFGLHFDQALQQQRREICRHGHAA